MARRRKYQPVNVDDPLRHPDHPRPVSRREFIRQGFLSGAASIVTGGVFSLFARPRDAMALAGDLTSLATDIGCEVGGLTGGRKVPFICFDLAGGANFAGSNVLVGQAGGQMDFLATAGYGRLGLPGDMIPGLADANASLLNPSNGDFVNNQLGLAFHADSPLLRGILDKFTPPPGQIDGCVIPARSDNDTGNNPHNPLYAVAAAGARGGVVDLIGSRSTLSGGNSTAPALFVDNEIRPTKVDRPSDVTGMVDVGNLTGILNDPADVTAVMESMARISHKKMKLGGAAMGQVVAPADVVKDLVRCGYLKAADIAQRFAGIAVDPATDPNIVGPIFSATEFSNDGEFRKTASVMKMVIDGHAGAGCITMGGYDYHTGNRFVGENRDLRAGRCIGAVLQYAATMNSPVMIYVFSDGSLSSNGNLDNSLPQGGNELGGRGKGEWTGDNSSTACSFFLVYNPGGVTPYATNGTPDHRQLGWFNSDGSVVTSSHRGANNVNLLVNTVLLNYMALNNEVANFDAVFSGLGGSHGLSNLDDLIAFNPLV
jgi:hypothetical protein